MNRLKGELSVENKRKHKRNKNNRWKLKNNTKEQKQPIEIAKTLF